MVKICIIDDSAVARELLAHTLREDPDIQVVGMASNATEALAMLKRVSPDLITMDLHMPGMDGIQLTSRIMSTTPVPIVIVTADSRASELKHRFAAIKAGALAVLKKPTGPGSWQRDPATRELIRTVKMLAGRKVERLLLPAVPPRLLEIAQPARRYRVIAIGASTGGPSVLRTVLAGLPETLPTPVIVVQHITQGFLPGMIEWLRTETTLELHLAEDDMPVQAGHVYFAPDGNQMTVDAEKRLRLQATDDQPSVATLFRSVNDVYGAQAIALLLTGMGKDGAAELKALRDSGAMTIAQDKDSSIVYGMPGEAVKLDAAHYILPAAHIASALQQLVMPQSM